MCYMQHVSVTTDELDECIHYYQNGLLELFPKPDISILL